MKLVLSDGLTRQNVMGFNLGPRLFEVGPKLDAALSLDFSEFKGQPVTNWRLVDFQKV